MRRVKLSSRRSRPPGLKQRTLVVMPQLNVHERKLSMHNWRGSRTCPLRSIKLLSTQTPSRSLNVPPSVPTFHLANSPRLLKLEGASRFLVAIGVGPEHAERAVRASTTAIQTLCAEAGIYMDMATFNPQKGRPDYLLQRGVERFYGPQLN